MQFLNYSNPTHTKTDRAIRSSRFLCMCYKKDIIAVFAYEF